MAQALTAKDLRALAIPCKIAHVPSRQLPDMIDEFVVERHDAMLDHIELWADEVAKEIAEA